MTRKASDLIDRRQTLRLRAGEPQTPEVLEAIEEIDWKHLESKPPGAHRRWLTGGSWGRGVGMGGGGEIYDVCLSEGPFYFFLRI